MSVNADIAYRNDKGDDLLNPATPGHFSADDIKTYKIVDGKAIEIYNGFMDAPRNFYIYNDTPENCYRMRIFLDNDSMLLRLNSDITDTITSYIEKSSGNTVTKKVWYNGKLMWSSGDGVREFTIVK